MNSDEINTNLEEFCRKYLSPSSEERERVSRRFKQLRDLLPGNEIFQSGSFERETAVNPVHDLDVIWVLPDSFQVVAGELLAKVSQNQPVFFDVKEPLKSLALLLQQGYEKLGEQVEIDYSQTHSVKISFPQKESFSIDVVPALKSGKKNKYENDIYLVPELQKHPHRKWAEIYKAQNGKVSWILSDPKGYINQSLRLNLNPGYRKSVKFAKVWKRSCNASLLGFELQSFHLELVMASIFAQNSNMNFYDTICLFLENAVNWLAEPVIRDMANNNLFVDGYLSEDIQGTQRKLAGDFAAKTLAKLQDMVSKNNNDEIYALLREALIATPPWSIVQNARNIGISCQIERRDRIHNSPSWRRRKENLPRYVLQSVNGPRQIKSGEYIQKEYFLLFTPAVNGLDYDEIRWLVVNNGMPALDIARIGGWRGNEFQRCEENSSFREERSQYPGMHWIDCYAIKEGVCIGTGRFYVGIKDY